MKALTSGALGKVPTLTMNLPMSVNQLIDFGRALAAIHDLELLVEQEHRPQREFLIHRLVGNIDAALRVERLRHFVGRFRICLGPAPAAQIDREVSRDFFRVLLGIFGAHDESAGNNRAGVRAGAQRFGPGLLLERIVIRRPDADDVAVVRGDGGNDLGLAHIDELHIAEWNAVLAQAVAHGIIAGRIRRQQDTLALEALRIGFQGGDIYRRAPS